MAPVYAASNTSSKEINGSRCSVSTEINKGLRNEFTHITTDNILEYFTATTSPSLPEYHKI